MKWAADDPERLVQVLQGSVKSIDCPKWNAGRIYNDYFDLEGNSKEAI